MMPQPIHRLKVDTALERAVKALDNVLNYEPANFNEAEPLKKLNRARMQEMRNELNEAFKYSLTLKPKW